MCQAAAGTPMPASTVWALPLEGGGVKEKGLQGLRQTEKQRENQTDSTYEVSPKGKGYGDLGG